MNLILWRHAEAEDIAASDLARQLTTRGRKQAQTVAKWLRARLPDDALILASREDGPALASIERTLGRQLPRVTVAGLTEPELPQTSRAPGRRPSRFRRARRPLARGRRR